jgi:hypothetical protein
VSVCRCFERRGFELWDEGAAPNAHELECPVCTSSRRAFDSIRSGLRTQVAIPPISLGWQERVLAAVRAPNLAGASPAPRGLTSRLRVLRFWLWAAPAAIGVVIGIVAGSDALRSHSRVIQEPEIVLKGDDPKLSFFVLRSGDASPRRGRDGQTLRPGDVIQLQMSSKSFRHVRILSVDSRGKVQHLFDWMTDRDHPAPTLVLDSAAESERVVAIFHNGRFDLARVERDVLRGPDRAADAGVGEEVAVRSFLIQKVPGRRARPGGKK